MSNLLPEILDCIFDYFIDGDAHTLKAWKQNLSILAVCHSWRHDGMIRVYNTAIIESSSADRPSTKQQWFLDSEPAFGFAASNIDLAASAGALPLLQKLVLDMDDSTKLEQDFDKAFQLMQSHLQVWPNLTQLCLHLKSCFRPAYLLEEADELARQLATALPNINHLTAMVSHDNTLGIRVMSLLVDNYAHQLIHIACSRWVYTSAPLFSKNLTNLNIVSWSKDRPLPKVNLDTLKKLTVSNIVHECQHGTFYSGSNSEANGFEFKSLKYLNLSSSGESDMPKDSLMYSKLSFPCLSVMRLNIGHKTDRLLTQSHFPGYIDKLVVRSPAHGSITLYRVKFDIDERSQFATYTRKGPQFNFLNFAKYLLENHQLYSELHAEVSPRTIFLAYESHQLAGLQTLVLREASPTQVLQVIKCICTLKLLTIGKLVTDVEPLEHEDCCDDKLQLVISSIEHVKVKLIDRRVDKTFASLFERVLVKTTSLKWLDIPNTVQVCCSLVNQFKSEYPHIQQLHVSAKYYCGSLGPANAGKKRKQGYAPKRGTEPSCYLPACNYAHNSEPFVKLSIGRKLILMLRRKFMSK